MKKFYVGIKGVIVQNKKVLLLQTNEERGSRWEVPGGRIDDDESIEQALHRELREELPNISSIVLEEVLDAQRLHKDLEDDLSLVLVFYKVTADFDGEPELSDEHVAYRWCNKEEAKDLVEPMLRRAIESVIDK